MKSPNLPANRLISALFLSILSLSMALTAGIGANPTSTQAAAPFISDSQPKIDKPQRVNLYFRDRMEPRTWKVLGFDLPGGRHHVNPSH